MALANVTTTFNVHDLFGANFDARRAKAWATTNAPDDTIHDKSTGETRIGGGTATINPDGTGTFTHWAPGADGNPTTWQTTYHFDVPDRTTGKGRRVEHFGPFTVTTSGLLTALVQEQIAIPTATAAASAAAAGASATSAAGSASSAATSASAASTARTGAETARAGAEAAEDAAQALVLSDLGTTDGQTRALVENPASQTAGALSATTVVKGKEIEGGQVPRPLRAPALTVQRSWPTQAGRINLMLWTEADGQTLYGLGSDASLMKSTDGGRIWNRLSYLNWGPGYAGAFMKTSTGTLLTFGSGREIRRSTDDGVNWTQVFTPRANTNPLGTQSWDIDPVTGFIYYGEYNSGGAFPESRCIIWRSTNDGATWTEFASFTTDLANADRVAHCHAVQNDHVAQRIVICIGDSTPKTGLYRVNAAGTGVEPIVTNEMLDPAFFDAPRSIGIIPFPDYIAWGSDSTTNPWLFRMARTEIGQPSPVVERIYRLNSTAWWSARASADGSRWVMSASQESAVTRLDRLVHLYAIDDQGASVFEVGSLAVVDDTNPAASLMPVGLGHIHGDRFMLTNRGAGRSGTWLCRLGYGGVEIAWPERLTRTALIETASSGNLTVPAGGTVVFDSARVPALATKLCIYETSLAVISGVSPNVRVDVRRKAAPTLFIHRGQLPSERQFLHLELAGPTAEYVVASADDLEFVVRNLNGTDPVTLTARVTFGFAQP